MYVAADPKPLEKGDSCMIAMKCTENGEELAGLTTDGRTYTAGMGYMPEGFDEGILGMQPGETRTFTFEGPALTRDFNEITQVIECTITLEGNPETRDARHRRRMDLQEPSYLQEPRRPSLDH